MGFISFLLESGILVSLLLGWPVYVYKWTLDLAPKSPYALGSKIYFELEDAFFGTIIQKTLVVLNANVDALKTFPEQAGKVRHALESEIESSLTTLSFARGQRDRLFADVRRRSVWLAIVWGATLVATFATVASFHVEVREVPKLKLHHSSLLLAGAVPAYLVGLVGTIAAKNIEPLLEDALAILKSARDDLRK